MQDFLDLFVLPLRKQIAREQFEADTLRVAHQALEMAAEVEQGGRGDRGGGPAGGSFGRPSWTRRSARRRCADEQFDAGNVNELRAGERAGRPTRRPTLDLAREEIELLRQRERLNRLLGLWGPRAGWTLAEELPVPPDKEPPLDHLETLAIGRRLDVDAARKQRLLMANAVGLARSSRAVRPHRGRRRRASVPDGPRVLGPSLVLELPIFDQRQAVIARLEAQERQAERRLTAVAVTRARRCGSVRPRFSAARQMVVQYREVVLPLRRRIVGQAQLHYNGMLIGVCRSSC